MLRGLTLMLLRRPLSLSAQLNRAHFTHLTRLIYNVLRNRRKGKSHLNLPIDYITRMKSMLNEEAELFFRTYSEEKVSGLRVNPLKIDREAFLAQFPGDLEPVPFCPTGFYYRSNLQPGKHPYHFAGLYYIQEPSAMFVAEVLNPQPGEKVLDLCAAPGGKTTQIAGMMNNTGFLLANEIHPKRVKALSENIERLGVTNALVTNESPEKLAQVFPGYFDRILVDAPCSGEGMFRKDPEAVEYWSCDHVKKCAQEQYRILTHAYNMLREDGILVYSTCTFSPEENEQIIERFVKDFPDMKPIPIEQQHGIQAGHPDWGLGKNEDLIYTARLWPHRLKGEGHFVAKLRKTSATPSWEGKAASPNAAKEQIRLFEEFTTSFLSCKITNRIFSFKQHLFSLPENCPSFDRLKVVRAGLHLGEIKKNRFEPNHALALAIRKDDAKHSLDFSSDSTECKKYLAGETLLTEQDRSWMLITVDGYPLGWGKEAKGILKNFYPKGLRVHSW